MSGAFARRPKRKLTLKKVISKKQNFTDEIFEIEKLTILKSPTYNLRDSMRAKRLGKLYQPDLNSGQNNGRI